MIRKLARLIVLLTPLVSVSTLVHAQGSSTTATVTGVVQDSTGGIIPGASVAIKNVATGVKTDTVTNSSGTFSVPGLMAGTYEATISLSGFKTVVIDKIGLTPGNTSSVGVVKLDIGQTSETVNVSAHTELIDTASTTVSSTISADQINELPLVTKNAMQFMAFLPGINSASGTHVQRNSTVMGLPQNAIAIVIDGVNIQDQSVKSTDGFYADIRPQTDLVEQVTVTQGTAAADSAGQGAVQIKFQTRSGTNQQTGSAYEYLRDTVLNSNSYFNEQKNLPKNPINWNQFGFRQGGPIVIPGVYDGHDKAFYFFNYEEFRLPLTASTTRTALSPQAQTGVFRYGCSTTGCSNSVNLLDIAARNGQIATTDPTVKALWTGINQAVQTQGNIQQNLDLNTFSYTWQPTLFRAEHLPGGSLDVNISQKHRAHGTFIYQKVNSNPDVVNSGYSSFPDLPVTSSQYSFRLTATASLRSTLSTNLINEASWGTIWSPVYFSSNITPADYVGGVAFNFLAVGGNTPTAFNVRTNSTSRNGSNFNFSDKLTWLKGKHSFSMGGVYTRVTDWEASHAIVPVYQLGLDTTNDPAAAMFTGGATGNLPNATTGELTSARNLYAMLTGRVTQVTGNAVLQPDGTYVYRGDPFEKIYQDEVGMFIQDQWQWRPNLTINAGIRYELQFPITPTAALYARNDISDVCGRAGIGDAASNAPEATIGCQFGKPGIPLNSTAPTYKQYTAGSPGYNLDKNEFAPSIGAAWQPNVRDGFWQKILGNPDLSTVRASYARAFNQPGLSDFLGTLRSGPGLTVNADRNATNQNLVLPGQTWPVLLSQPNRLGPPATCGAGQTVGCIPTSATYPQPINFSTGITAFDPNYQTSHTDSWSFGFQRSMSKNMSVEVRYVGNYNTGVPTTVNYNEQDIYNAAFGSSSSFVDEFRKAQGNLAANVAANRGATFAYTGIPGTAPLPIFLASYTGKGAAQANDPAAYTGTQWANTATVPSLSYFQPNIGTFASTNATNGLFGNPTFRGNGIAAGMPSNFWVMNPDVQSANVRTAEGFTKYHTIQFLLNRRLSNGLAFSGNYAYQVGYVSSLDTLFRDRATLRNTTATAPPPHAWKGTVNYELPFGRGQRFATNAGALTDAFIGGWQVNLTGRVETGRLIDIGDVKLVNMSLSDLQKSFKYYVNPADNQVYDLPQALIANTIKAFSVDATNTTGHPLCTGANSAVCGGPDPTQPYIHRLPTRAVCGSSPVIAASGSS